MQERLAQCVTPRILNASCGGFETQCDICPDCKSPRSPFLPKLLKEKHDNTVLIAETFQQKKLLAKYNRVSQYALDEFEALQDDLKLERDLRSEAEKFAHEMLVEQKKLKRQSQMLIPSVSPTEALQKALAEINTLTHTLETQRLEHQQKFKDHIPFLPPVFLSLIVVLCMSVDFSGGTEKEAPAANSSIALDLPHKQTQPEPGQNTRDQDTVTHDNHNIH
ncbi:hypothetical protein cypCar_00000923 [Cyprinus carpio]|nr:hypothetical protein cypCar_00000923 [Cyprinus carpio]